MLITSPEFTSNLTGKTYYKSSRWFELSSSNSGHDPVDWNDYTKSCIWDLLHHIDVGSFYLAMFDEFHQHTKVHRVYILMQRNQRDEPF
jgi:hypothetical protein